MTFLNLTFTFLDVVVWQSASILQLFARKDQTLLIRGDTFKIKTPLIQILWWLLIWVRKKGGRTKELAKSLQLTYLLSTDELWTNFYFDVDIGDSALILGACL